MVDACRCDNRWRRSSDRFVEEVTRATPSRTHQSSRERPDGRDRHRSSRARDARARRSRPARSATSRSTTTTFRATAPSTANPRQGRSTRRDPGGSRQSPSRLPRGDEVREDPLPADDSAVGAAVLDQRWRRVARIGGVQLGRCCKIARVEQSDEPIPDLCEQRTRSRHGPRRERHDHGAPG